MLMNVYVTRYVAYNYIIFIAAEVHKEAGIAAVSDEHYSGSHWLASFATYLETRRGLTGAGSTDWDLIRIHKADGAIALLIARRGA